MEIGSFRYKGRRKKTNRCAKHGPGNTAKYSLLNNARISANLFICIYNTTEYGLQTTPGPSNSPSTSSSGRLTGAWYDRISGMVQIPRYIKVEVTGCIGIFAIYVDQHVCIYPHVRFTVQTATFPPTSDRTEPLTGDHGSSGFQGKVR